MAGDCCEDLEAQISLKSPPLQCISQYEDERWPFYAVTSCPVDYSNIEVAERCRTPIEELTAQPGNHTSHIIGVKERLAMF